MDNLDHLDELFSEDVEPDMDSPLNTVARLTDNYDEALFDAMEAEIQQHMDVIEDSENRLREVAEVEQEIIIANAVDAGQAAVLESLIPGCVSKYTSLKTYSRAPSAINLKVTLEEALPHAKTAGKIAILGAAALIIIKILSWISGMFGGGDSGGGGGEGGSDKAKKQNAKIRTFAENVDQYPKYNLADHKEAADRLNQLIEKFGIKVSIGNTTNSAIGAMDEQLFIEAMKKINTQYFREIVSHSRQPKVVDDLIKRMNSLVVEIQTNSNKFLADYKKDQDFPIEHYLIDWAKDSMLKEISSHVKAEYVDSNPKATGASLRTKWKEYLSAASEENMPKKDDVIKSNIDFQLDKFNEIDEGKLSSVDKLNSKFEQVHKDADKVVIEKRRTEVRKVLTAITNDWFLLASIIHCVMYSRSKTINFCNVLDISVTRMAESRTIISSIGEMLTGNKEIQDDVKSDEELKKRRKTKDRAALAGVGAGGAAGASVGTVLGTALSEMV